MGTDGRGSLKAENPPVGPLVCSERLIDPEVKITLPTLPSGLQRRLKALLAGVENLAKKSAYVAPPKMTDEEFAEKYLKNSPLFSEEGSARWFDPPPIHSFLTDQTRQSNRALMQLPREHAKSTKFSIIRPLRLICENRNVRIVIISGKQDAAAGFAKAIRLQLEFNEAIIRDYGVFRPSGKSVKWSDTNFTVVRPGQYPQPTVQAVGRGGQIVGGRYDYVILDDVEDYDSTRTDAARKKTYDWLRNDVIPIVMAGGFLGIIQTPQHEGDLVGQMRQQGGVWKFLNVPAEVETKEVDPVSGVRRKSSWPKKWPIYFTDCEVKKLEQRGRSIEEMCAVAKNKACPNCPVYNSSKGDPNGVGCLTGKRFEVGEVYYRLQYLVDILAFGGDVFRPKWWRYYRRSDFRYDQERGVWVYKDPETAKEYDVEIVMGIDPAIAEEDEAIGDLLHSRFAAVVLGYVAPLRRRFLLYYVNERLDFPVQKKVILEVFNAWLPKLIGIEEVAFQKAIRQDIKKEHHLPIRPMKADNDKFRRITSLTPEVEAGNFYLMERMSDPDKGEPPNTIIIVHQEFKQQAESFPKGSLMDLLDAWYYADLLISRPRALADYGRGEQLHEREVEDFKEQAERRKDPQHWTWDDLRRKGILS